MKRILIAALAACLSLSVHAQQAGDNLAVLGWFHVAPQQSSSPLTTYVAPTPINTPLRLPNSFTSTGTGLSTNNADTAGLVFSHFLTDHIALTSVAGVPPVFKVYGHGTIMPPGRPAHSVLRIWVTRRAIRSSRACANGARRRSCSTTSTSRPQNSARSWASGCRTTGFPTSS